MRVRPLCLVAAILWLALPAAPAHAQLGWLSGIGRGLARDVKRRFCWPEPFVTQDRLAVRAPFAAMVAKGWEHQNLLGEHHFDPGNGQLNESGRLKLRSIITESPPQHRTVYVQRCDDPAETAVRLAHVRGLVSSMVFEADPPLVVQSDALPRGWPSQQVDAIGRKFSASLPDPVLPKPQGDSD